MKPLRSRAAGILLHPTSLPGPHGCGDFGAAARRFVDWLASAGQRLWQVLPLGLVGPGNSPYMSVSAFAGNPLLIDLVALADAGWLSAAELDPGAAFTADRVDYAAAQDFRRQRLQLAAERFFAAPKGAAHADFARFAAAERDWLDDYALFVALLERHGGEWQDWPAALARREAAALADAARREVTAIDAARFCQWCFFRQWEALKRYASERGVAIIGDVPIFVAGNSADVWVERRLFDLDGDGRPRVVAGVPPDYFSADGQHWGNPLYRWPTHAADGFRWWTARLRHSFRLFDIVRLDHFRGFESYWEIPATAPTAVDGRWRRGPGAALFAAARRHLGDVEVIAEDLGIITPAVTALREELGLPGMRILQFAFDGKVDNPYLPHNFDRNTVVYTGTHDNDTSCGWWQALAPSGQDYVRRYLGVDGRAIHWDLIRAASASVARYAIVPMQDVLGLDSTQRMNRPGVAEGSWEWRFAWSQVAPWQAAQLADFARLHGRLPEAPGSELAV